MHGKQGSCEILGLLTMLVEQLCAKQPWTTAPRRLLARAHTQVVVHPNRCPAHTPRVVLTCCLASHLSFTVTISRFEWARSWPPSHKAPEQQLGYITEAVDPPWVTAGQLPLDYFQAQSPVRLLLLSCAAILAAVRASHAACSSA